MCWANCEGIVEELCFKGKEGKWGLTLRGMNVDELEGNPKVTLLYSERQIPSDVYLLCWRQSREQSRSQQHHIVLRGASELDLVARWATLLCFFSSQKP